MLDFDRMEEQLSARTLQVLLDPDSPDMAITVEAPPEGIVTALWVKEELCRQDPTGSAKPESFHLVSARARTALLDDGITITAELLPLILCDEESAGRIREEAQLEAKRAAEAEADRKECERKAKEEADRHEANQRAVEEMRRKAEQERERKAEEEARRLKLVAQAREERERAALAAREAAEREAREEAERGEREAAERARREESERKAREELAQKAREEEEQRAKEAEGARREKMDAERRMKAEMLVAARETAERTIREMAARRAEEGAETVKVRVTFKHKAKRWDHTFAVEKGSVILELKRQMTPEAPGEANWFELQRSGRRVCDLARIRGEESFAFAFLGAEEGSRRAAADVLSGVAAGGPRETSTEGPAAQAEEAATSEEPQAKAAVPAELSSVYLLEDLKWFVWNETWYAANSGFAAKVPGELRAKHLSNATADAKKSNTHFEAMEAAGALPSRLLRMLRQEAEASGQAAAAAALEGRPLDPDTLEVLDAPADVRGKLWDNAARAVHMAAAAVADMLRDDMHAGRLHQADYEMIFKRIRLTELPAAADACDGEGSPAAAEEAAAATRLPAVLGFGYGFELKWMVWNKLWAAANTEYSKHCIGHKQMEKLWKAKEDAKRAELHFATVAAMKDFSLGTLEHIKQQTDHAGITAAAVARKGEGGQKLPPDSVHKMVAPDEIDEELWSKLVGAIGLAAASVAELLADGSHVNYYRGKLKQVDFEVSWHRLYDPPAMEAAPEDNGGAPAVLAPGELRRLPESSVKQFRGDGYLGAARGLSADEVRECCKGLVRFEGRPNAEATKDWLYQGHVMLPWLHELACHPALVGAAASVLGTDTVLLYSSRIALCQRGHSGAREEDGNWHVEGEAYHGAVGSMEEFVNIYVALTPHVCGKSGGFEFAPPGPPGQSKGMPRLVSLQPGEFCAVSTEKYFRMGQNASTERRCGLLLRFVSGRVRDIFAEVKSVETKAGEPRDFAVLACGKDAEGHFRLLPAPVEELGAAERGRWSEVERARRRRYNNQLL